MSESIKIPDGYKQTKAGVIPEDWNAIPLGDLFTFKNGLNKSKEYFGFGIPIVNYMDVYRNPGIYTGDLKGRVSLTKPEIEAYAVRKGDVFFTRTSETVDEVGVSAVMLDEPVDTVFSGFVLRARPLNDRLNDSFKKYCFSSINVRKQITSKSTYTTRALTNGRILSGIRLACPLEPEQKAIAKALSDIDSMIDCLERVIAKKQDIKLATMQQLLTGKKRLPGFTKKWLDTTFSEVIDSCSSGATPYRGRPEFYRGDIRWITSGELNYDRIYDTVEKITKQAVQRTNLKILPAGTFLMAITGLEAEGTRGNCGIIGADSTTNQSCMAVICSDKLLPDYLFYYYVLRGKSLAFQYCQGTKQQSYTAKLVKKLPIQMPSDTKEQAAIVAILSDIDDEIKAFGKKLAKTQALKQGVMQELLTGRIRFTKAVEKPAKKHNWAIDEAVIISTLVHKFGTDNFPLGRKRYTKISYLFHRYIDGKAEGYLKKAAGPYNPKTKYGGVETLACKNGYIQNHKNGKYSGFVIGDKVEQALGYFKQWYGEDAMQWLEQFRYQKNDILELWATVDMAVQDLEADGKETTVENVKNLIKNDKEWKAKLKRDVFSDDNIAEAIIKTRQLLMEA